MARRYTYHVTVYKLHPGGVGEKLEDFKSKLKVSPPKHATSRGRVKKIRRQRGWTAIEVETKYTSEIILYRKLGSGKYPNLIERFWPPEDLEEKDPGI